MCSAIWKKLSAHAGQIAASAMAFAFFHVGLSVVAVVQLRGVADAQTISLGTLTPDENTLLTIDNVSEGLPEALKIMGLPIQQAPPLDILVVSDDYVRSFPLSQLIDAAGGDSNTLVRSFALDPITGNLEIVDTDGSVFAVEIDDLRQAIDTTVTNLSLSVQGDDLVLADTAGDEVSMPLAALSTALGADTNTTVTQLDIDADDQLNLTDSDGQVLTTDLQPYLSLGAADQTLAADRTIATDGNALSLEGAGARLDLVSTSPSQAPILSFTAPLRASIATLSSAQEYLFEVASQESGASESMLRINNDGQLVLAPYGNQDFTGTPDKFLAVTSAGAVIEADVPVDTNTTNTSLAWVDGDLILTDSANNQVSTRFTLPETEPWYEENTLLAATGQSSNIYFGKNVGVGNFSTSGVLQELVVDGEVRFGRFGRFMDDDSVIADFGNGIEGTPSSAMTVFDDGTVHVLGNIMAASDRRLKRDIKPWGRGIETILALDTVTFKWKDENKPAGEQVGFVAQNVRDALPQAVQVMPDDIGTLSVDNRPLIAASVNAIQELVAINQQLAQTVELLEARVAELESTLASQ